MTVSQLVVDAMDDARRWTAVAPDGATPSGELSLADETVEVHRGEDRQSGRLVATTGALDHRLRRTLPDLDLTDFDELRLWVRSNRVADGSPPRPFYLELRLASEALDLDDPASTWHRYIPVAQTQTWELARLGLDDLPPEVGSAVNLIQLRCVDASAPLVCFLDDFLAVRQELLGDVDAALLDRLHHRITIDGTAVPAFIHPAEALAPAGPSISVTQYDVQLAGEQVSAARARGDFTDRGFVLRPPPVRYDLYYRIEVNATTRPQQRRLLEFLVRSLSPRGELVVNGDALPFTWASVGPWDRVAAHFADGVRLYLKVAAVQELGAAEPVTPSRTVTVEIDQRTRAS